MIEDLLTKAVLDRLESGVIGPEQALPQQSIGCILGQPSLT